MILKRETVAFCLMMSALIIAFAHCSTACTATQEQKSAAADSAYAADQADCVRIASTREEADKCRAAKRAMWLDGGNEGGAR